ncbi:NAD(P)/FAD-dependent oxidoreductase [Candidatus Uabimicrobium sp. HlEnr_7]|uniref:NAD(P)/FAD-dependent oxidoreductase n=1 Tax=Candidatus Uabimicrobium helgolandensis TaxID=3095367 RepID=UPI0035573322
MQYDIVVIGSGIAGATAALVFSRIGHRVLVIEKRKHPRFAIGESTIPTTTHIFMSLSKKYNIPELRHICHYTALAKRKMASYPKRHFWYGLHKENAPLSPCKQLMFETFPLPIGPDVHMLRSDADSYLVSKFAKYGVDYIDETEIKNFDYDTSTNTANISTLSPQGAKQVLCKLVVDASGHASYLAKKFNLREKETSLKTKSRTIFGHFRGVKDLDSLLEKNIFRYKRNAGTMHHCFDGGWIWVIPFDNGITSIGLMLDTDKYPNNNKITPEEEMQQIIQKFPTIKEQLEKREPLFPLIRTGRVQFSSHTILGDGFILTPHAAAFVDPLFSTGILLTLSFIERMAHLLESSQTDRFVTKNFQSVEKAFFQEIQTIDLVVSGTWKSFRDFNIFKQYWRTWIHSTTLQYFTHILGNSSNAKGCSFAYGAAIETWKETLYKMHSIVYQDGDSQQVAESLQKIMDSVPHPYHNSLFEINSKEACSIHTDIDKKYQVQFFMTLLDTPEIKKDGGNKSKLYLFILSTIIKKIYFKLRYCLSKLIGTSFYKEIRSIHKITSL